MTIFRIERSLSLAALLLVAGCTDSETPEGQAPDAAQDPVRLAATAEPLDQEEAFRLAFGGDAPATRQVGDRQLGFTPAQLVDLGSRRALISLGEMADACHSCAGSIAVHYLAPGEDGAWSVDGEWLEAGRGSSWGEAASDWSVSSALLDQPVIVAEGGFTGQGYTCTSADLIALNPNGPHRVSEVPLSYSNEGTIDGDTAIEGHIAAPTRGQRFQVAYTGKRDSRPVQFTETYLWQDGRFARVSAESRLESC